MSHVWLVKATPYDIGGASETTVYFSTGRPDGLAPVYDSKLWPVRAITPLNVDVTVFAGEFGGAVPAFGSIQLDLGGQDIDTLLDYAWDGRDIEVRRGNPTDAYASMTLVFKGTARSVSWNRSVLTINLSDYGEVLGKPAQTTLYAGTGDAEGGDDLKGKTKPMAFGVVKNAEPTLINSTYLVYQVHSRAIEAVDAVFDGAVPLTSGSDYASYTALTAATVTAGSYATCLAEGLIRLGALPAILVTVDVQGDNTGGYVETAADIIERHAVDFTDLTSSNINAASFTALNTANSAACGVYVATGENPSCADIYTQLMVSVGGFWTMNASAEIVVRQVAYDTAAAELTKAMVTDVERLEVQPPYWRSKFGYARSWRVHSENEIAAGAGVTNIGVKANYVTFATAANEKALLHGFDSTGAATDTDGSFTYNGAAYTVDRSQFADGSTLHARQAGDGYIVYDYNPLSQVAQDSFTGTTGTALDSHTPNVGTSWTAENGSRLELKGSNNLGATATGTGAFPYTVAPATAAASMYSEITIDTWATGSTENVALIARWVSAAAYYALTISGTGVVAIRRGTAAATGSSLASVTITKTAGIRLRFQVIGSSLKAYSKNPGGDWVEILATTNTGVTSAGKGGVGIGGVAQAGNSISTAWRLSNFECVGAQPNWTVDSEKVEVVFARLNGSTWEYDNGSSWTAITPSSSMLIIGRMAASGTAITQALIVVPQLLGAGGTTIEPKSRVDFVKQRHRFATSEDSAIKTIHKLAREREVASLLDEETDAETENDRQHALLDAKWDVYQVTIQQSKWDELGLELGDTVTLTLPRFGLDAGKDFIIGGKATGQSADWVQLLLWGGV